jgi:hypothetical protein
MKYQEHVPHSSLQNYVKCFWLLEKEYTSEAPYEEVTPDACIELIFNFGAPYVLQTKGMADHEMPAAFLVGLQNRPLLFRSSGTVRLVATRFYSWGTVPFINIEQQGASTVALQLGHEWHELTE